MKLLSLFIILYYSSLCFAFVYTESFEHNETLHSTQMVWNVKEGVLHAPLLITGWNDQGTPGTTSLNIGKGIHGAFNLNSYSQFSENGDISGNVIRLNTDTYETLEVTEFVLESGWTLQPTGTKPLVIKSLSSVVISGTIQCSGENGNDINADKSVAVSGGSGRCGGGDGGSSIVAGASRQVENNGVSGGASVSGGIAGDPDDGNGGGGGGGYIKPFAVLGDKPDPTDGAGVGGARGSFQRDDSFTIAALGAGSGGGAGSAYNGADIVNHSSGGGGGAGGGVVHITAKGDITVSASGAIYVNGGAGGGSATTLKGGAGGGGAGGSVFIATVGDIITDGIIKAERGAGGTSNGNNGGDGSWGRTWVIEKDGFASGGVAEDPQTQLNVPGQVRYQTGTTYTTLTKAIDLYNSKPIFKSLTESISNQGGATLTVTVAQSDSDDISGFVTYDSLASLSDQELKRYIQFKIELDNTSSSNSVTLNSLSLTYDGNVQNDFEFVAGCGLIKTRDEKRPYIWWVLCFLLPVFTTLILKKFQKDSWSL